MASIPVIKWDSTFLCIFLFFVFKYSYFLNTLGYLEMFVTIPKTTSLETTYMSEMWRVAK